MTIEFPESAPTANPVFFRTYSRRDRGRPEAFQEVCDRVLPCLIKEGKLTDEEAALVRKHMEQLTCLPAGRVLWVAGTDWFKKPENFPGAFNCNSTEVVDIESFALIMEMAMMGCGTGAVLEERCISQLPSVKHQLEVTVVGEFTSQPGGLEDTVVEFSPVDDEIYNHATIYVGDSRRGWVESYQNILAFACGLWGVELAGMIFPTESTKPINLTVNISNVRSQGQSLKGFGGVANPNKLKELYPKVAKILNGAVGRQLTAEECCLLIDEAALVVVAGNVRRCLPEDALVHTQNGLVLIKDVEVGTLVQTPLGFRRILNKFKQGPQDVYIVTTGSKAFPLRGTLNHRVAVFDQSAGYTFVKIEDLKVGSYLAFRLDNNVTKDTPMVVKGLSDCVNVETYDLEIDEAHCFYCDGYLMHNSAGMRQFDADSPLLKQNLWQQNEAGEWAIDPDRDALRMANHTRVFHHKPSREECIEAVRSQYYSGEGAIQWAGEAIARANVDVLSTFEAKNKFLELYDRDHKKAEQYLATIGVMSRGEDKEHRVHRYGLNPCGEITGKNFKCNLSEIHLNQIDPLDYDTQDEAFRAGAIAVSSLLIRQFTQKRYLDSRLADPIVGASFTGLFDFFVIRFGLPWLQWFAAGRPEDWRGGEGLYFKRSEREYLTRWREVVERTIKEYCDRHGIKTPNRCTTVQPAGTKSLLTGASPGWHPPKAQRYIRRITFAAYHPVALACLDYGYNIVPSQDDKDENGQLLKDPFDDRVTGWLVEIPIEVTWANLPGADGIDISQFSALAQFDFYMQVQKYYTTHNTSATIELKEHEIEEVGDRIHQAIKKDEGYISACLMARFETKETYPRLPFEPISKEKYEQLHAEVLARRKSDNFHELLMRHETGSQLAEASPAGCDSDKCLFPEIKGEN